MSESDESSREELATNSVSNSASSAVGYLHVKMPQTILSKRQRPGINYSNQQQHKNPSSDPSQFNIVDETDKTTLDVNKKLRKKRKKNLPPFLSNTCQQQKSSTPNSSNDNLNNGNNNEEEILDSIEDIDPSIKVYAFEKPLMTSATNFKDNYFILTPVVNNTTSSTSNNATVNSTTQHVSSPSRKSQNQTISTNPHRKNSRRKCSSSSSSNSSNNNNTSAALLSNNNLSSTTPHVVNSTSAVHVHNARKSSQQQQQVSHVIIEYPQQHQQQQLANQQQCELGGYENGNTVFKFGNSSSVREVSGMDKLTENPLNDFLQLQSSLNSNNAGNSGVSSAVALLASVLANNQVSNNDSNGSSMAFDYDSMISMLDKLLCRQPNMSSSSGASSSDNMLYNMHNNNTTSPTSLVSNTNPSNLFMTSGNNMQHGTSSTTSQNQLNNLSLQLISQIVELLIQRYQQQLQSVLSQNQISNSSSLNNSPISNPTSNFVQHLFNQDPQVSNISTNLSQYIMNARFPSNDDSNNQLPQMVDQQQLNQTSMQPNNVSSSSNETISQQDILRFILQNQHLLFPNSNNQSNNQ
ncbi:predicted protein [Naegleria gruberi]|uniref:Predicted protein n=1 Tax=Naegleria gruberi TaxID=5762 RepID=D2VWY7_NAEGR|nr:uncharacterized protein NAEGRDRAFT_59446 [Naegleria gruberi]EFC38711.1 predicted protein [Naegleria gruberi]|eukprot:XP_002671455.1 predicted protein [Naegleria gruberi strain NEG-M]